MTIKHTGVKLGIVCVAIMRRILLEGEMDEHDDVCGFCGKPGADKIPHPVRWPGEDSPGTDLVHADCESYECGRAHGVLTDKQRIDFLRTL